MNARIGTMRVVNLDWKDLSSTTSVWAMCVANSAWKNLSSVSSARAMGVVHKFCRKEEKQNKKKEEGTRVRLLSKGPFMTTMVIERV